MWPAGDPAVIDRGHARPAARGRPAARRDATLLVVLASAGLRPQDALALEWRHVRERTLLVERAVSDGQLNVLKIRRQPRTVSNARAASRGPRGVAPGEPRAGRSAHRCSRRRRARSGARRTGATGGSGSTGPLAESVGLAGARPYDLRHAFTSLLIHEGRPSVVEIAAQLGHNPTVCLDTYAHVIAEERAGEHVSVEEQILQARTHSLSPSSRSSFRSTALTCRRRRRARCRGSSCATEPRTISGCPSPPAIAWPGR